MARKKPTPRASPEPPKADDPLPALGNNYDRAVRLLQDLCDDRMILMQNPKLGLYLVPAILDAKSSEVHPPGTVEYQLSDGPPNERVRSLDFTNINKAVTQFITMELGGGWNVIDTAGGKDVEQRADSDHAPPDTKETKRPRTFLIAHVSSGELRRKVVYNSVDGAIGIMFPSHSNAAMLLMPRVVAWAKDARDGDTLIVGHYGQITVCGDERQTAVLEVVETVVVKDPFKT